MIQIFRTLFADITTGTIARVRFFWSMLGLWLVTAVLVMIVGNAFGLGQDLGAATPEDAQGAVLTALGPVGLAALLVVGLPALFAQVNLMAKRFRDMGLPGWIMLAVVIALTAAVSAVAGQGPAGLVNLVVWLVLLFGPPRLFRRA